MKKYDDGVIVYENNKVPECHKTEVKINYLGFLNAAANRAKMKEVLMDTHYVDVRPDGSIIWKGRKNKGGYALIDIRLLPDIPDDFEGNYIVLGHRLVQELINGGAPTNALVCHRSDIPSNINPDDLFLGTHAQNAAIITMHGRRIYPKGKDHWCSKLDECKVITIVHLYYSNVKTIRNIARDFGVCPKTVSDIVHCRGTWAQVAKNATEAAIAARMGN